MSTELPTGLVTFLFSDVEGSTRYLSAMGAEQYARSLGEHRRDLRACFARYGGVEVDTQGDAFFVAFPTAAGALAAAADAQNVCASGPLRVRIGLHTGMPLLTDDGYVGLDVHRAARIAAAGHGGQVLVSARTAEFGSADQLRDLGPHRLKDLSAPERIYQLGDGAFPSLLTLYRTNLPVPTTPLIGRQDAVADVVRLITDDGIRLLTLTGPGGTGKTKLALHAAAETADDFPDGIWWVPLAALTDHTLVMPAIASALSAEDDLAEHIADSRRLIVIDNFEQVVEAAVEVSELLRRCPRLVVIVTSREALRLSGEYELAVEPLEADDAVALFVSRATAVRRDFVPDDHARAICARLDNLPLAIELAAARMKMLSTAALLQMLDRSLPVLAGGDRDAPERQRTLRATIAWSHDLLVKQEQAIFARLSVFRGGSTLDAAMTVAGADLDSMQSLVDKSLVRARDDRYSMLETIREFAGDQLESETSAVRQRHAEYFLAFVTEAEPFIRQDSEEWTTRLDRDHDNIRAALDHLQGSEHPAAGLRFAGLVSRFWYLRGHFREAQQRLEIALATDRSRSRDRVRALNAAAVMAISLANDVSGGARAQEALDLAIELGDEWAEAYARLLLANTRMNVDDAEGAVVYLERASAIFRGLGDDHYVLIVNRNLALASGKLGDIERQRALHHQNLEIARARGSTRVEANSLSDLAMLAAFHDGNMDEGAEMLRDAIRLDQRRGDNGEIAESLGRLAAVLAKSEQAATAARLLGSSMKLNDEMGVGQIGWWAELNDKTREDAVGVLGAAGFEREFQAGRELSLEDAVRTALAPAADHTGAAQ